MTIWLGIVTTIVALAGAVIAYFQFVTARRKLMLDLFDRRLKVVEMVEWAVGSFQSSGKITGQNFNDLLTAKAAARFLFGGDVQDYFNSLQRDFAFCLTYTDTMLADPATANREALIDQKLQLRDVRNEWDLADTKRWQFRAALNARVEFEEAIVDLQQRLETSIALLMMVKNTDRNDAEKIKERQKLLDGISFLPIFGKIAGARTAYTDAINAELGRLLPKLEDARADAKL
ncbi:hypothetical protein IVB08_33705 [Bradyrhizobium sp. 173]|uniref:hypothetical protein n=1 Tax=Bradyrhizobium sp. 173 TaxID=2782644 RepID=UPI001FFBECB7|nr:hypothetical protein [Bradyrhizobium sp. 173]MCK1568816.1 hypothetical protein [Bradyrhizobium sp. 173]